MNRILEGSLVRLSAVDPEEYGKALTRWRRDSEFNRLADSSPSPLRSSKATEKWLESEAEEAGTVLHLFTIRSLADDRLIGDISLYVANWSGRDAFVGIAIGERELWGRGYGTDAMTTILRYAFTEINLRRVTLTVFEYNPRAIRSYEKAGFRHEGRMRQFLNREGRRWDMLFMGILREEWMESNGITNQVE
jgi:RimJ/RimL family protein N-acetyltransferase